MELLTQRETPQRAPASAWRPRLSIVIVNWNTRALLLRLLGQLLPEGTPPPDAEVLVVDNASADDSIAAATAAYPRAQVLPQPHNGGFAYGVNRGLAAARGDWILLLNTDTDVTWDAIDWLLDDAEARADGAVFGPRITDEHGDVQRSEWRRHGVLRPAFDALGLSRWLDRRSPPETATRTDCVSGCVFLIRRSALRHVGGMDERFFMYFEEADLCARVHAAGFNVWYLPGASFVHAGGLSSGQARERTFLCFRESRLLYHAAWHGRLATEWVRGCLLLGSMLRWAAGWLRRRGRARRRLHAAAMRLLARPGLVRELCARPRRVPPVPAVPPA
jgi:GT2 family glycosyltransferase